MIVRLIKASAYALLGYVLYELFLGISETAEKMEGAATKSPGKKRMERALNEDRGRMSGRRGQGREVQTDEANGGTTRHRVGRGVV